MTSIMLTDEPLAREAPALAPFAEIDPACRPAAPNDPVLAINNIQGNILAGFNKDFQTLIFLKITNVNHFKLWLKTLVPFVATTAEVLDFNRLFKAIRARRGDSRTVQSTWMNIAFSFSALQLLTTDAGAFTDVAFKEGMAAHAETELGDPADPTAEGNKNNWVIGGPGNEAHVVLIFASDDQNDLSAEVRRLEDSIYAPRGADGKTLHSGVEVIFKQHGATLPPPLTGHEHFGFLDGVSQPGIRGLLSNNPSQQDVLTLRQNPLPGDHINQGKPGQDLLYPGEFVFGYPDQDAGLPIDQPGKDSLRERGPDGGFAGPDWAQDGSYLVFRRLRQDVPKFHAFLSTQAAPLGIGADLLGAKIVGRWQSGAPILRAETADIPKLGDSDCANNHFEFQAASPPIPDTLAAPDPDCLCTDKIKGTDPVQLFAPSPGDPSGAICPFAGHIRKAYPRNDITPEGMGDPDKSEQDTQTHRLLRRGIPFGQPFREPQHPNDEDSGDRGLLFLAYQTSLVDQFEFVTKNWINNPSFATSDAGFDPLIGQSPTGQRTFQISLPDPSNNAQTHTLQTSDTWVIPTGGGYFFAPAISALDTVLTAIPPPEPVVPTPLPAAPPSPPAPVVPTPTPGWSG